MKPIVAKVGGSLFDLPDLRDRLRHWVDSIGSQSVLLVPGGGAGADVIRDLDALHQIGEEDAHWLALQVLSVNAHFLSALFGVPVVARPSPIAARVTVLDAYAFCTEDEHSPGSVGHSWSVTSDTIAARVATVAQAQLVLLKSTDLPAGMSWTDAARLGLIDSACPSMIERSGISVTWINLRRTESATR